MTKHTLREAIEKLFCEVDLLQVNEGRQVSQNQKFANHSIDIDFNNTKRQTATVLKELVGPVLAVLNNAPY